MNTPTDFKARYEARLAKAKEWADFWNSEEPDAITRPVTADANILVQTIQGKLDQLASDQATEAPASPTPAPLVTPQPGQAEPSPVEKDGHSKREPAKESVAKKATAKVPTHSAHSHSVTGKKH